MTSASGPSHQQVAHMEGAYLEPVNDPYERFMQKMIRNHPGFHDELVYVREELAKMVLPGDFPHDLSMNPDAAPYPVKQTALNWGLHPYIVALAAVDVTTFKDFDPKVLEEVRRDRKDVKPGQHLDKVREYSRQKRLRETMIEEDYIDAASEERSSVKVQATPFELIIRVPRPVTPRRKAAVRRVLDRYAKQLRADTDDGVGEVERVWRRAGNRSASSSERSMEALPWFDRWNTGKEQPWEIFKSLKKAGRFRDNRAFESSFRGALEATQDFMLKLSPDGIRPDRPSRSKE